MLQLNQLPSQFSSTSLGLIALLLAFGFSPSARAAINCTLTPGSPNTVFNINNLLDAAATDLRLSISLNVSCSKSLSLARVGYFCMRIGKGSGGVPAGAPYAPRWLKAGATTNHAGVQIYKDPGYSSVWGSNEAGAPSPHFYRLTFNGLLSDTDSFSMPLHVELLTTFPAIGGASNVKQLAPGTYTANFNDSFTQWQARTGASVDNKCTGSSLDNQTSNFAFSVTANIQPQCKITAATADVDFGTQPGTATNLQGATSVAVQCTRTTPYFIGVKPGNNNANGAGVMTKGVDQVPYQLRQAAGMGATIWGNTATSVAAGNGVGGTGTGSVIDHPVYVTVPSADAAVGSYSDTVTVTVNY